MEKRKKEIEDAKKQQAQKAQKLREEREKQKKEEKQLQSEWMKQGIETKKDLRKAMKAKEKAVISGAKGKAMAHCFQHWNGQNKAGDYDKKGYLQCIKSIQDEDDPKYDNIMQINTAVEIGKDWDTLRDMIESLL